jgi:hypothetical protein
MADSMFANVVLNNIKDIMLIFTEIFNIMPDAIILGTGFFSFITASSQFFILFVTLLESLGIYYGINKINKFLGVFVETSKKNPKCKISFANTTLNSLAISRENTHFTFPSYHIYTITVFISYLLTNLMYFKDNIEVLNKDSFASRLAVAAVPLLILLFISISYRLFNRCESSSVLLWTMFLAMIIGFLLFEQNKSLFGNQGINILGIPLLYNVTADGNPIYLCNS